MTKKERFEKALSDRNDIKLAEFWNELEHEFDDPYSIEKLAAKSEWMLLKSQSENHRLMINFLEIMELKQEELK